MKKELTFKEHLISRLRKSPKCQVEFINAVIEEKDSHALLLALKAVAEARGGMTHLASQTGIARPALYRMLNKNGNPGFGNLEKILEAMGFRLKVESRALARA